MPLCSRQSGPIYGQLVVVLWRRHERLARRNAVVDERRVYLAKLNLIGIIQVLGHSDTGHYGSVSSIL